MNIRINKLILQNFKGIKFLEINAEGESLSIYGDNATGKTTVFDAFTWLLFNKDSLGRADFGIKTQDVNGNPIHNLEHSVECEMQIDDAVLTLKKVFAEKWTKKRGSAEAEFSGHETKYFVNEVPTTKKEYEQKITSIIDETLFKIITNPLYFNENLKWQDRRAILLNLCSNINDDDILATNAEFAPLSEELKGRTVQEYKKIIQSKQSAINDELKAIPQRISEATLAIPVTVAEVDETEKEMIEKEIADLNNKISAVKNGAGMEDAKREIDDLKIKSNEIVLKKCDTSALETELLTAKSNLAMANTEITVLDREITSLDLAIQACNDNADALRKKWMAVNEKRYTDSDICPTCGQAMPAEEIEKAKANFNMARAAELESITEQGKRAKAEADRKFQLQINAIEKSKAAKKKADSYTSEIDRLTAEIEKTKAEFSAKKQQELDAILMHIAESEKKAENISTNNQPMIDTINTEIAEKKAKLSEINKAIANKELAEKQKQRIADLTADEKRFAVEYAKLEQMAFLIDEFIKHKVELLSEEINSHFKYAKFKLFDVQINGGIADCCEVTYKGVPYSDLNNASRINIGLDVINTLCAVNGKTAPIIIDNAESVTNIAQTEAQQICLVVSATDDMLRVEKGV